MLSGRKLRNRRRAGLLAGAVAVVAAVAVGVPALSRPGALPQPVTGHLRVTVNPPGPHSPAGLIASGLIGGEHWSFSIPKSPTRFNCVIPGAVLAFVACNRTLRRPTAADPISFEGEGSGGTYVSFGEVWESVVSARVELSDGTSLTLHPADVDGVRLVAFADPASLRVDRVTAYSRGGEIATAIPFDAPDGFPAPEGFPSFAAWLRPGQTQPGQFSGTFGSGVTATAYVGPWGSFLVVANTTGRIPVTGPLGTSVRGASSSAVFGSAAESVSYLTITRTDGSTLRAAAIAVGPQKFWAVPLSRPAQKGARWTAYDAAGRPVASGNLA